MTGNAPTFATLLLRIFLPFAAGYYFSYFLRNVNAVIAPELTRELGVSAADLGLLTSAYLLAFGAVQLPLGLALGRWLATTTVAGRAWIEALVMLPLVLPPTVLGYYMLVSLGGASPVGRWLAEHVGIQVTFNFAGSGDLVTQIGQGAPRLTRCNLPGNGVETVLKFFTLIPFRPRDC